VLAVQLASSLRLSAGGCPWGGVDEQGEPDELLVVGVADGFQAQHRGDVVGRAPAVVAPIVGATRPHHLPEAAAALEVTLTSDEIATLEEPYTNRGPSWF
jgi:hypothetical protein